MQKDVQRISDLRERYRSGTREDEGGRTRREREGRVQREDCKSGRQGTTRDELIGDEEREHRGCEEDGEGPGTTRGMSSVRGKGCEGRRAGGRAGGRGRGKGWLGILRARARKEGKSTSGTTPRLRTAVGR